MTTIDELLQNYREIFCMSEVEKGEHFERLMKNFLLTYAPYRGKIKSAWVWKNFPHREQLGGRDLGIDIVAETFDKNFIAVQCKFYSDNSTVEKSAVDSFISNSARSFFVDGEEKFFSQRIWISTTENYTANAKEMFKNQSPEIQMINLESLRRAQVNWSLLDNGFCGKDASARKPKDYQFEAIEEAEKHFQTNSRGQMIMACGTGKTFTSLKIAEKIAPHGKILFLVPSISLLSQTLEEWATFSENPINAICICSDSKSSNLDEDEIIDVNLIVPAMTDTEKISAKLENFFAERDKNFGMTVVFSTYQSIEIVHEVQKKLGGKLNFDFVVCDEAHRTAAYTDTEKNKKNHSKSEKNSELGELSPFTAIHDENFIHAEKRLYMTATPKLYKTDFKKDPAANDLTVWSMDDEKIFGTEFYRISFKTAIDKKILSPYKLLIFAVNENEIKASLREKVFDKSKKNFTIDNVSLLIGCINALSKRVIEKSKDFLADDLAPMKSAVIFCPKIAYSKEIQKIFSEVQADYKKNLPPIQQEKLIEIELNHVDGTTPADKRSDAIQKLKKVSENTCQVLSNVRCLSEGVDVPALDAVIFLSAKKSKIDIIQAVGRALRKADNKKYGYIVVPMVFTPNQDSETATNLNEKYRPIVDIINALAAHDESMNIEIERLRNTGESEKFDLVVSDEFEGGEEITEDGRTIHEQIRLDLNVPRAELFAHIISVVGDNFYWYRWAEKISKILDRHRNRIAELISVEGEPRRAFEKFISSLKKSLGTSVDEEQAIDMLAQHLITRPIFEAIFENTLFVKKNPVSQAMQRILKELDKDGISKERDDLKEFEESVAEHCRNMGDAKQRQEILIKLYDSFFKIALPKTAQKLGIVYTPVEVVDFILNSVNDVLKKNFGKTLSAENVHILDPFTGTGTFIVRLIQSGLIQQKDLFRKFSVELHANEIVLLAYYIAAINIENAFNSNPEKYFPFQGIVFADTFQSYENQQEKISHDKQISLGKDFDSPLQENSERMQSQLDTKIEIIIGNPPYSVGQKSANDNAQNNFYPALKNRIAETYAKNSSGSLKKSLYDSYIKAFRWASDRISDGVIGFVTNGGWLDGDAMAGMRKIFAEEFSQIFIFNLRGDSNLSGEARRKEKDNIFGNGTKALIVITILVKNSAAKNKSAEIFYYDIGDHLTREEKLKKISEVGTVLSENFQRITPNEKFDWINQRNEKSFDDFILLAPEKKFDDDAKSFFTNYGIGVSTNRDAWVYNFSEKNLENNINLMTEFYNAERKKYHENRNYIPIADSKKISWSDGMKKNLKHDVILSSFQKEAVVESSYRPFCKQNFYNYCFVIDRLGLMPAFFPENIFLRFKEKLQKNLLICVSTSDKKFSPFITDKITDLHFNGDTQCFPLYWYEEDTGNLFEKNSLRHDGVSDWILSKAKNLYGEQVTKEEIFYYVYGFLHLPGYREKFAAELKKSLPRIFLVDNFADFEKISAAGRQLAEIHLNYEKFSAPAEVEVEILEENYLVSKKKMKWSKDKKTLHYNEFITIKNIPPKSFKYVVNGRSPLEWIIDRYYIKTDKDSGIENNPNLWCEENNNPRYILDLILSCITVSLKTLEIVENLPEVNFD